MVSYCHIVPGILLLWSSSVCSFQGFHRLQRSDVLLKSSYSDNNFESENVGNNEWDGTNNEWDGTNNEWDGTNNEWDGNPSEQEYEENVEYDQNLPTGQAYTRSSPFAPDPNLETSEFREQLRENMKAEVERRRNEEPAVGNQVAKNYMDSL